MKTYSTSRHYLVLFFFLASLSLSGCGYTTGSLLPTHIKTIHVKPFKNRISYATERTRNIYFPLLEVDVREAIVDRFLFDGHLRIASEEAADVVLSGELLGYSRDPLRYTDDDDVEEYRLHITVSLKLWDTVNQELMWEETSFVGETTYFALGPLTKSETTAVQDAVTDVARRVVERTIEDW